MQFITQPNYFSYLFFVFITQIMSIPIRLSPEDSLSSTSTQYSPTSTPYPTHNPFTSSLKIIAIFVAGLVLVIIVVRICLILTNSHRSSNNPPTNHRRNLVQPQVAIIGQTTFKPDLPPAYTDAIANIDIEENKLPSYGELNKGQNALSATTATQM
jgi:hypothetical protein